MGDTFRPMPIEGGGHGDHFSARKHTAHYRIPVSAVVGERARECGAVEQHDPTILLTRYWMGSLQDGFADMGSKPVISVGQLRLLDGRGAPPGICCDREK